MSTQEMPQVCVAKAIPEHDDNAKGRSHLKRIVPHTPLFSVLDRDGIKEYLAKRPIRNQVGADLQLGVDLLFQIDGAGAGPAARDNERF